MNRRWSRNTLNLKWFAFVWLLAPVWLGAQPVPGLYIVELAGKPVLASAERTDAPKRAGVLRERRLAVQAEQRQVRRSIEAQDAVVYGSVDTIANALFVRAPARGAARLKPLRGIKKVRPVYEMRLSLDRALPLHKVPEAWTGLGGGDLAGAGIKIGVIDTGIDVTHPAFRDPALPLPEGFPRVNKTSDLEFTSNKVIAARSYLPLFGTEADDSARDTEGHGTAVAMAAAGAPVESGRGVIAGVAPKAYLGSYNVFRRSDGRTRGDIVLKAFDDAVADGMDVINLSLGSPFALRPNDDFFTAIVERVTAVGVVVVAAAGNDGPEPFTMADVASAPAALTVGATSSDRIFSGSATLSTGERYQAVPGSGPNLPQPLTAPLRDASALEPSGLACDPLPSRSLAGQVALILRGTCLFENKLNNAQAAGAAGALVYSDKDRPDAITMAVGSATLPASMVSHPDGLRVKEAIANGRNVTVTIDFRQNAFAVDPNRIADFTSIGPNTDFGIKPDLVATGVAVNTALPGGFQIVQGTSISAPIVAGSAAVVKAARPGYSGHHYRSLLINAATALIEQSGTPVNVQRAGGGVLNLEASLTSTLTAYPTAVSFGTTSGDLSRNLSVFNLSGVAQSLSISIESHGGDRVPALSPASLNIPPAGVGVLTLRFATQGLAPGESQGLVRIRGSNPGADIQVPYWHAVPSSTPAFLKVVYQVERGTPGQFLRNGISVRVTDSSGVPLTDSAPSATVVSGGGSVLAVSSADEEIPGLYDITVRLGPSAGNNVFRVERGAISREVTIPGR